MNLQKTENYHEEMGYCVFFSFSRDSQGNILGEPPEICLSHGYIEDEFDDNKWTHFTDDLNINQAFIQAGFKD